MPSDGILTVGMMGAPHAVGDKGLKVIGAVAGASGAMIVRCLAPTNMLTANYLLFVAVVFLLLF